MPPTLDLARLAKARGVKHGVVQDKLFLPGIRKLKRLIDGGFFGRIFSVRGDFGYWVFEGDWQPSQRPSWNYRSEDGGGIIADMLCHWRYVLDHTFGPIKRVNCFAAIQIPERWDESGRKYKSTAEDAAYASFEIEGGIFAHMNTVLERPPLSGRNPRIFKSTAPKAAPSPASASAKPSIAPIHQNPSGTPTSPTPSTSAPAGSTSPTIKSSKTRSKSSGKCF